MVGVFESTNMNTGDEDSCLKMKKTPEGMPMILTCLGMIKISVSMFLLPFKVLGSFSGARRKGVAKMRDFILRAFVGFGSSVSLFFGFPLSPRLFVCLVST